MAASAAWLRLLFCLALLQLAAATEPGSPIAKPGCQSQCGMVDIPYPFGTNTSGSDCYRRGHKLRCDGNTSKLFLGDFQITGISIRRGELHATMPAGQFCYSKEGKSRSSISRSSGNLTGSRYGFSARNVFTVIGCDTMVRFSDPSRDFVTGCMSLCNSESPIENGTCKGIGCCQISIPEGLKYFQAEFQSFDNYTKIWDLNNCGYGFLAEQGEFEFNTTILRSEYNYGDLRVPFVMDWVVGNETCAAARRNATDYACRAAHGHCIDYEFGGYRCNCSQGFEGNPYLQDGCTDINECNHPDLYPCNGTCINTPGDYNCTCAPGSHADNPKLEKCIPDSSQGKSISFQAKLLIGVSAGFLFLMVLASWIYWVYQKRKMMKLKQDFFRKNGGLFLEQQISSAQTPTLKIFSIQEMRSATNNFDEKLILGKGGSGIVYKGILDDGRVVAVKKSMMIDQKNNKEFAKEMFILSQINHVNIVKLLGCCLEVEVPIIIYEYIPNGTLFHLLHYQKDTAISFDFRLRLVTESAEALSYLHSAADPPILHGDIKSSNILLDNNYQAKVSDFGTSVLAPNDKAQFTTFVQGTCGYLDPEYMQTCQLTEKSDVYSFGVVLVELLTRRKAFNFGGTEDERSLAMSFVSCMKEDKLHEILDAAITSSDFAERVHDVSEIALQCLSLNGDERPTMKEVNIKLQALRTAERHPWVQHDDPEEREWLLDEPTNSSGYSTMGIEPGVDMGNQYKVKLGR